MKDLSSGLWHNALKDKLGGSRGSERELIIIIVINLGESWEWWEVLRERVRVVIFGDRSMGMGMGPIWGGLGRRHNAWSWRNRGGLGLFGCNIICKSLGDLESWGTPWPWQKLHRHSWTLRQRGAAARNELRQLTIDCAALWFHVTQVRGELLLLSLVSAS